MTVPCIELAAPKAGRSHQAGLEHIELVVPSLTTLVTTHPDVPFKRPATSMTDAIRI